MQRDGEFEDTALGRVDPVRGPRAYRMILSFLQTVMAAFFRETEVTGIENLPESGGGLLVAWHPNGLVDPGLILTSFPRQVVFGARHGLFKIPGFSSLLHLIGTVPIYRASDNPKGSPEERRAQNTRSLDALATQVARGAFSALFPEGFSHDAPSVQDVRTGAARLYYRARQLTPKGQTPPVIVPVGLHYDRKAAFRSSALVTFYPPLTLPPELDLCPKEGETREESSARCHALTGLIGQALEDAVQSVEDWPLFHLLHRSRTLIRAERVARAAAAASRPQTLSNTQSLQEKTLGFARVRQAYAQRLETHPREVATLRSRVERYHRDIRALGLKDHELDEDPPLGSRWLAIFLVLQLLAVFLILPPILLFGYLINGPAALLLALAVRIASSYRKDVATLKILGGVLLFPMTWAAAAGLAFVASTRLHAAFPSLPSSPWRAALMMLLVSVAGAALALRYQRVAAATIRAVRVRLTRRRRWVSVARLRKERASLSDALLAMAEGLELPGQVEASGRVANPKDPFALKTLDLTLPWE